MKCAAYAIVTTTEVKSSNVVWTNYVCKILFANIIWTNVACTKVAWASVWTNVVWTNVARANVVHILFGQMLFVQIFVLKICK